APLEAIRVVAHAAQAAITVSLARLGVGVLELPADIQVLVELRDVVGPLAPLRAGWIETDVRSGVVVVLEDDGVLVFSVAHAAVDDCRCAVPAEVKGSLELSVAAELEEVAPEDMIIAKAPVKDAPFGRNHRSRRRLISDPAGGEITRQGIDA